LANLENSQRDIALQNKEDILWTTLVILVPTNFIIFSRKTWWSDDWKKMFFQSYHQREGKKFKFRWKQKIKKGLLKLSKQWKSQTCSILILLEARIKILMML
jgi:hypothetical protein